MSGNENHKSADPAELLAPAGNFECFKAALNAGADAVYLGGSMFGARAFAGNFDKEELLHAIHMAHLYGKKVYLTVNTLLRNEELEKLADYIRPYYEAGLDAAIVQDYGVFILIRECFPKLPLHASTQMTITGRYGAQLLKDMGAARIVTARELSLAELKEIHENVEIEIESFIHGALCYSYSGQCLLSSMIGGRSGNRGRCAQPCRLPYSCGKEQDRHLLSPKDLCTVECIPDIMEAGVFSLKIEGRMKGPEYVAGTVSVYRRYLDRYLEKGRDGFAVKESDIKLLMDLYNRGGFCKGYYYQQNDKNGMTFDRPNHQGLAVGKIKNGSIDLTEEIHAGDVLELCPGTEFTAAAAQGKHGMMKIPFMKGYKPQNGKAVYRTKNAALLSGLYNRYVLQENKIPVKMRIVLKAGEAAKLTVAKKDKETYSVCEKNAQTKDGQRFACVSVFSEVLEISENRPAAAEDVKKQLLKLGNTVFSCTEEDIETEIFGSPFVPVKLLNDLRRTAVLKLEEEMTFYKKRLRTEESGAQNEGEKSADAREKEEADIPRAFRITAQVMKKEQLKVLLEDFSDTLSRIYVCTELEGIDGAADMCAMVRSHTKTASGGAAPIEVFLAFPYIFRSRTAKLYTKNLDLIARAGFDGVLLRSPEELEFLKENGLDKEYEGKIQADYNVYAYNTKAFCEFRRQGFCGFTLSEEMNAKQLKGLCRSLRERERTADEGGAEASDAGTSVVHGTSGSGPYLEKIVYGHLPLMVSAGCTRAYTSQKSPCGMPGTYFITDRMKKRMPTVNSCTYCYNLIYNSEPEYLIDRVREMREMGVNGIRFLFDVEAPDTVGAVMRDFILQKEQKGSSFTYTRGHYNRGVD